MSTLTSKSVMVLGNASPVKGLHLVHAADALAL
jgi:hypothetical protein